MGWRKVSGQPGSLESGSSDTGRKEIDVSGTSYLAFYLSFHSYILLILSLH